MIDFLRKKYRKEQFAPSWIAIFVNPFYFARKGLADNIKELSKYITGKTLDIGCGNKPYESFFDCTEYIGLEYDSEQNRKTKKAEYFYDGNIFPFENEIFESIVMFEVLEHVFNPNQFIREISRVLKNKGGGIC